MKKSYFEILLSILLGVSWALVLIGGVKLFLMFLSFGVIFAISAGFFGSLFGLFLVLLVELTFIQVEKLKEIKKQTRLLEIIANQTQKNDILSNN